MRWHLQIPTILRSTSFSTCHECHSQCSLQNTLAELSHSDHLGTLSKDCSRELQATGKWEEDLFMQSSGMGQLHAMISVCCKKWYRQIPIYLYHLISTFLPVNLWPFIRIYLYMSIPDVIVACRLCGCLHHGIHFQACEHVLLGDLGWALDSRYWYNVIHMSN